MRKYCQAELIISKEGKLVLDLNDKVDTGEIVSYYLRAYRGRNEMAQTLQEMTGENNFSSSLESIRCLLADRNLVEAKSKIDECKPEIPLEYNELKLELARYFYFTGQYQSTVDLTDKLLSSKDLVLPTRMTCYQLKGVAHYELRQISYAIANLKKASELLEIIPHTLSGVVATAHLVKILAEQGQFFAADSYLKFLESTLDQITNSEAWITRMLPYLRAKFHFYKNSGEKEQSYYFLSESLEVSKWLKDTSIEADCIREIGLISQRPKSSVVTGEGWVYLGKTQILLVFARKKIVNLQNNKLQQRILTLLASNPLDEAVFFEKVWGLKYNSNIHSSLLRSTLSKIRKNLPDQSLRAINGIIHLV